MAFQHRITKLEASQDFILVIYYIGRLEMKIMLNPKAPEPIYVQIYDSVVALIASGELMPGDILPSSRKLAKDLQINYITVNKAYDLLESEDFIRTEKKKVEVQSPSEDSRREFLERWKNTESMMITEARAKKIKKSELAKMFKDIMNSIQ